MKEMEERKSTRERRFKIDTGSHLFKFMRNHIAESTKNTKNIGTLADTRSKTVEKLSRIDSRGGDKSNQKEFYSKLNLDSRKYSETRGTSQENLKIVEKTETVQPNGRTKSANKIMQDLGGKQQIHRNNSSSESFYPETSSLFTANPTKDSSFINRRIFSQENVNDDSRYDEALVTSALQKNFTAEDSFFSTSHESFNETNDSLICNVSEYSTDISSEMSAFFKEINDKRLRSTRNITFSLNKLQINNETSTEVSYGLLQEENCLNTGMSLLNDVKITKESFETESAPLNYSECNEPPAVNKGKKFSFTEEQKQFLAALDKAKEIQKRNEWESTQADVFEKAANDGQQKYLMMKDWKPVFYESVDDKILQERNDSFDVLPEIGTYEDFVNGMIRIKIEENARDSPESSLNCTMLTYSEFMEQLIAHNPKKLRGLNCSVFLSGNIIPF